MHENPKCTRCELHRTAHSICVPSNQPTDCKLAIYLDHPNIIENRTNRQEGFAINFVRYCLQRANIPLNKVLIDWIVKCYPPKGKMPSIKADRMTCVSRCSEYRIATLQDSGVKSIVVLGSLGNDAMVGRGRIGEMQGAEWPAFSPFIKTLVPHIWVGYSPLMLLEKASEAGSIYRIIVAAAEEAGLNPKTNHTLKPFNFNI